MIEVDLNHQDYATLSDDLNFSKLIEQNVQVQSKEIIKLHSWIINKKKTHLVEQIDLTNEMSEPATNVNHVN